MKRCLNIVECRFPTDAAKPVFYSILNNIFSSPIILDIISPDTFHKEEDHSALYRIHPSFVPVGVQRAQCVIYTVVYSLYSLNNQSFTFSMIFSPIIYVQSTLFSFLSYTNLYSTVRSSSLVQKTMAHVAKQCTLLSTLSHT